ncbi:MAG: ABC transporter permease, partial [Holophagales bacterium]|nr:ABC transporter permease [Holophagales bacterium]
MLRASQTLRRLLRSPSFSLISILTLALGVGAVVTLFTIVDAVLVQPLPLGEPERLVMLGHSAPGIELDEMMQSESTYFYYKDEAESLESVALAGSGAVTFTGLDQPRRLRAAMVTPSFFEVARVSALVGRTFTEEEGRPSGPEAVLLSEDLWRRLFDARESVLGTSLEIDGRSREVVGIVPADLDYPDPDVQLWMPMRIDREAAVIGAFGHTGVARLAPGVELVTAEAELDRLAANLEAAFEGNETAALLVRAGLDPHVKPLRDLVVGDVEAALWILFATVGFVLLIAAANVANLFLVRAEGRQRETAIRAALGAGIGQLGWAAVLEALMLSFSAALAGLGLAHVGIRALVRYGPQEMPRLHEIGLDLRSVFFAAIVALALSLVLGAIPVLKS